MPVEMSPDPEQFGGRFTDDFTVQLDERKTIEVLADGQTLVRWTIADNRRLVGRVIVDGRLARGPRPEPADPLDFTQQEVKS